jgi:ketosteroid isomerase-like protein
MSRIAIPSRDAAPADAKPILDAVNKQLGVVPTQSNALEVVNRLFASLQAGASPTELASFYDENTDWYIPGDTENIPWIGKRTGREEIAEHYRLLREIINPEKLDVIDILTKGNRVVVLGYIESRYKGNNKLIKSEFSIDIVIENGLITRYHLLEDSFDVSVKAKP